MSDSQLMTAAATSISSMANKRLVADIFQVEPERDDWPLRSSRDVLMFMIDLHFADLNTMSRHEPYLVHRCSPPA